MQAQPQWTPREQRIARILALPAGKLEAVNAILTRLEEQAEDEADMAAVDARRQEPTTPFADVPAELGISLSEVEAASRDAGLTQ